MPVSTGTIAGMEPGSFIIHIVMTDNGDGIVQPTCTEQHACTWLGVTAGTPPAHYERLTARMGFICMHCGWCGITVAVPAGGTCAMHGDVRDCPDFDWTATLVAPVIVRELTQRAGKALTPRAWQYLDRIAGTIHNRRA